MNCEINLRKPLFIVVALGLFSIESLADTKTMAIWRCSTDRMLLTRYLNPKGEPFSEFVDGGIEKTIKYLEKSNGETGLAIESTENNYTFYPSTDPYSTIKWWKSEDNYQELITASSLIHSITLSKIKPSSVAYIGVEQHKDFNYMVDGAPELQEFSNIYSCTRQNPNTFGIR